MGHFCPNKAGPVPLGAVSEQPALPCAWVGRKRAISEEQGEATWKCPGPEDWPSLARELRQSHARGFTFALHVSMLSSALSQGLFPGRVPSPASHQHIWNQLQILLLLSLPGVGRNSHRLLQPPPVVFLCPCCLPQPLATCSLPLCTPLTSLATVLPLALASTMAASQSRCLLCPAGSLTRG